MFGGLQTRFPLIEAVNASRTITPDDFGKVLYAKGGITLTFSANVIYPSGFLLTVVKQDAADVTITRGGGVFYFNDGTASGATFALSGAKGVAVDLASLDGTDMLALKSPSAGGGGGSSSRFNAVSTDPHGADPAVYDMVVGDDNKLIVVTDTHNQSYQINVPAGLAVGFSFALSLLVAGVQGNMTLAFNAAEHVWSDESGGDISNVINLIANSTGGTWAELVKVTATKWQLFSDVKWLAS